MISAALAVGMAGQQQQQRPPSITQIVAQGGGFPQQGRGAINPAPQTGGKTASAHADYSSTVKMLESSGGKTSGNLFQISPPARARFQPKGSNWDDPHTQEMTLAQ